MKKIISYVCSFPAKNILIFITNLVYITASLLGIYKNNQEYFFENALQTTNVIFYCFVILSFVLIKNTKLYFFVSLFLILDLPVSLKTVLLNSRNNLLNFPGIFGSQAMVYLLLFCIAGVAVFFVFKYNALKYFQTYLLIFYCVSLISTLMQVKKENNPTLQQADGIGTISKNYYFLLFDEYPNEQIIKQYNICTQADYPSSFLSKEGFQKDQNVHSNFISTETSTLTFLTGSFQRQYNVNMAISAIYNNSFTKDSHYSFRAFSLFDNNNRPNSQFCTLYFKDFNNILTRKFIPLVVGIFNKRGVGRYTDWDDYNCDAITKLAAFSKNKQPQVVYIHFYTPHIYPLVWGQSITDRIKNANQWQRKAIKVIDKNDSKAGVIIFSDHGLRMPFIPVRLWTRNILYFRNLDIDTNLVNKNGLVDLIKSIKY